MLENEKKADKQSKSPEIVNQNRKVKANLKVLKNKHTKVKKQSKETIKEKSIWINVWKIFKVPLSNAVTVMKCLRRKAAWTATCLSNTRTNK